MDAKISILFFLKRAKVNSKGLVPIFQRITIAGKRIEKSTGKFIDPTKWSAEGAKMKGTSAEARTINSHLDILKIKVLDAERDLYNKGESITAETINNKLIGVNKRERMLIPIFEEHNRKMKELIGLEFAAGTYERYETSLRHTKDFLSWKYNTSDIAIEKIDHAFITEYEFYLRSQRKCANNTTVKYIKNFQKIIKQCLNNRWIHENPFVNYKCKIKEVVRDFLDENEIEEIINKDIQIERLEVVRDIFIFSCFTGLAYIDVKQLSWKNRSN